jgi:hypothetical protein
MARESFEDEATASFLNRHFVPIKVDREERPEVDAYYMKAVQAMTGGGGWPLSVFLTPDLKPFYGGTYFPPEPRQGMPSFRQVLEFASSLWKDKREAAVENATQVATALAEAYPDPAPELPPRLLEEGVTAIAASYDLARGGYGGPPKFPMPLMSGFLLRHAHRTGDALALKCATGTLDAIMRGGIRDHLGGGFHRYSTDAVWLIPHFEKMLYDNAQLAKVYVEAHLATGRPGYMDAAREALAWMAAEMRSEGGGFYSAQDADTRDGEGKFYTWTPGEVEEVLGKAEGDRFCSEYGVTAAGNFEGRSILHLGARGAAAPEEAAAWKKELYRARGKRPRPAVDGKVLTSWNGLAISAFAYAGAVTGDDGYVRAAREAAEFVLGNSTRDGVLLRRWVDGEAALEGTLEDYAFLAQGLVDLFEASAEPKWMSEALRLAEAMKDRFEDRERGGFYLTTGAVPARLKEGYDGVTPSGNSAAAACLIRLAELTGRDDIRGEAERTLRCFVADVDLQPASHAAMLSALDLQLNGVTEVVVVSKDAAAGAALEREAWRRFSPDTVLLVARRDTYEELSRMTSLLEGRRPGPKARAFVCRNSTCGLPAETPEALGDQLARRAARA